MARKKPDAKARQWIEAILEVSAGMMTASKAAEVLGVSRKTYYKWEKRALEGMLAGLCDRSSGRPGSGVDGEKQSMIKEIQRLKKELALKKHGEEIRRKLAAEGGGRRRRVILVEQMVRARQTDRLSYRDQCDELGVAYSSFMRWKERVEHGGGAAQRLRPKKAGPLGPERPA